MTIDLAEGRRLHSEFGRAAQRAVSTAGTEKFRAADKIAGRACDDWLHWLDGNSDALLALAERSERLEAAIRQVLADEETGTGWGPDVTAVAVLRAALEGADR